MRGPSHPCLSPISSQTTWGPHAPCGGQSPRSPGNRTHLGQLSLDRMGTPLRDPCAPCCFLFNDQEALDEQPGCHLVTTCPGIQAERLVLGDAGCFTKVGCVPNPRATPFIPRTEVHYSTQDNSSSASDTETAFQIIFCANSDDSIQILEAGS